MADKAWKQRERQAAATFGARRQVLSGSSGRDDRSESDSTHDVLYIETKLRKSHAVRTLFEDARAKAKKEKKTPILMLADHGRPGFLLCIRPEDLGIVAEAYAKAQAEGVDHAGGLDEGGPGPDRRGDREPGGDVPDEAGAAA